MLVIDDDESLGAIVADVLGDEGYAVVRTASPQLTRELLATAPTPAFDLILSDSFRQPDMCPYVWLDELKALTSAPLVIISGWEPRAYADCQDRGFAASLPKPFDVDDLISTVAELLGVDPPDGLG